MPKLKILVIKDGSVLEDREHILNGATTLGRANDCSIKIDLPGVSRCHCTIVRLTSKKAKSVEYSLIDGCYQGRTLKKSTNGLLLNKQSIESGYLKHGDEILIIDKEIKGVRQFARAIYVVEELESAHGTATQH